MLLKESALFHVFHVVGGLNDASGRLSQLLPALVYLFVLLLYNVLSRMLHCDVLFRALLTFTAVPQLKPFSHKKKWSNLKMLVT